MLSHTTTIWLHDFHICTGRVTTGGPQAPLGQIEPPCKQRCRTVAGSGVLCPVRVAEGSLGESTASSWALCAELADEAMDLADALQNGALCCTDFGLDDGVLRERAVPQASPSEMERDLLEEVLGHGILDARDILVVAEAPEGEGERMQKRARFSCRDENHIAHARAERRVALAQKQADEFKRGEKRANDALNSASALLPAIGKMLGKEHIEALGRKRNAALKPEHFAVVVRGMHLPLRTKCQLGINQYKLVCAGAKFILQRQEGGARLSLECSKKALSQPGAMRRAIHVSYCHLWDEVELKFRINSAQQNRGRVSGKYVIAQTMVQRGSFTSCVWEEGREPGLFQEYWLCQPKEVEGTNVEAIHPAVTKAMPSAFHIDDVDALKTTLEHVSHFTIMAIPDRGSGNLLLLKYWASILESSKGELGHKALFFPDTCGLHSLHRGKKQVTTVKPHIMRHYSIANLHRLADVQNKMSLRLEADIFRKVHRVVGEKPDINMAGDLYALCDALYDWDAKHHLRKDGRPCQFIADLKFLCQMVNGDLLADRWVHHCWDPATQRPCCKDREETCCKTLRACACALFGDGEPIPSEQTWTHVLKSFKKNSASQDYAQSRAHLFPQRSGTRASWGNGGRWRGAGQLLSATHSEEDFKNCRILHKGPKSARACCSCANI